jgi:hypothetical protein
MGIIEKGLFFWDPHATKNFEENDKYFIVMSDGEYEDDILICFSLNTEKRMDIYHVGCNKGKAKFILSPDKYKFSFLKKFTALNLHTPSQYKVSELFNDEIKVYEHDKANEELLRQIKNCIDEGYLLPREIELIKKSFIVNKS